PTVVLERPDDLPDIIAARGWDRAIVKPTVSASGHDTALVDLGTAPQIARALADGRRRWPAMVQPFIEAVRTVGEWSLVFIDGQFSHAAIKRPAQGDFRVQKAYGGNTAAATPPDAMIAAGHRVLRALDTAPMYA